MRVYAEYYMDGKEQCGSDRIYILDGRNSLDIQIQDVNERMERFKKFNGFAIFYGDLKHSKMMYRSF